MGQSLPKIKLTTCQVVVTRGLKRRLQALTFGDKSPADIVIGRCEDCGSLIYADDLLTSVPEPTPEPVDEWEYYQ